MSIAVEKYIDKEDGGVRSSARGYGKPQQGTIFLHNVIIISFSIFHYQSLNFRAVKDGSTMRKSGYPVPSVAADSGYGYLGPAKHEKAAIYVVNQRISNV